jgi:hypothetical protein
MFSLEIPVSANSASKTGLGRHLDHATVIRMLRCRFNAQRLERGVKGASRLPDTSSRLLIFSIVCHWLGSPPCLGLTEKCIGHIEGRTPAVVEACSFASRAR